MESFELTRESAGGFKRATIDADKHIARPLFSCSDVPADQPLLFSNGVEAGAVAEVRPEHLLQTTGLNGMQGFYDRYRMLPTSEESDVALILSHIAYRVRGGTWNGNQVVTISDHFDHRKGVQGWNNE